jgi:hypothetical protein
MALVVFVERSRLGRLLRGLADSPLALTTLGANANVSRVIVFCLSTFLAGVAGATFASQFAATNQDSYNYVQSLVILAVMAISGRRTITVAVVAPILIFVIPGYISNPTINLYLHLGFGVAAVIAAALSQGSLTRLLERSTAAHEERLLDPVFGAAGRAPVTRAGSRTRRAALAGRLPSTASGRRQGGPATGGRAAKGPDSYERHLTDLRAEVPIR